MATGQTPKLFFSLDTPSPVPLSSLESYIKGWFVFGDGNPYQLWLSIEGKRIPAFTGLPRPDVARHHQNNPLFKYSGFLVRFRHSEVNTTAKLIAVSATAELVLAENIEVPGSSEAVCSREETALKPDSLFYQPLISVLVGVPEAYLYLVTRSVESVLAQSYSKWQLCIAYGSTKPTPSRGYFEAIAAKDTRIRMITAEAASIPELCNQALESAEGDFVLRLDYRDELHPSALAEITKAVNERQSLNIVYAEEDEMDFYGQRTLAFHKPDFDPEAFLSWNFIGNMIAIRRDVLVRAGGYRANAHAVDDWDVVFRVLDLCESSGVYRIPKVLYHFRKGDDTTAPLAREVNTNPGQALQDHLERVGIQATLEPGLFAGSFRVRRENFADSKVAVIIQPEDGAFQHAALAANVNPRMTRIYELLGSGLDPLTSGRPHAASEPATQAIRNVSQMSEDVFVFVNRPLDTLNHLFCEELAIQAMRQDCGVVTGISLDRAGRVLHSGFEMFDGERRDAFAGIPFTNGEPPRLLRVTRSVDSISDEFFAIKRSQLDSFGGLQVFNGADMPEFLERLVETVRSQNLRVLVTPYAVATFDLEGPSPHSAAEVRNTEEFMRGDNAMDPRTPEKDLIAAEADRRLAVAQIRDIASERNQLRRELAALRDGMAELRANTAINVFEQRIKQLQGQIEHLNAELDAQRRINAAIQNSLSWKMTSPFRTCLRLLRRKV